jgi:hypothetical protein
MRQMSQHPQNPSSAETLIYLFWSLDPNLSWLIQSTFCYTIAEKLTSPILLENLNHSAKEFYFTEIKSQWPHLQGPATALCPKPVH